MKKNTKVPKQKEQPIIKLSNDNVDPKLKSWLDDIEKKYSETIKAMAKI